jgi:4,5-dihydroxyphthalate decarboxylase
VTGGLEQPGRGEKLALHLPPGIRVTPVPAGQTLSAMLESGAIDALYTAREPSSFRAGGGRVRRLFEDFAAVERDYFARTRVFPIMHVIAIRRDVYQRHRWIAASLVKAFAAAQRAAYDDLAQTAALKTMLPWLVAHLDDTRRMMGDDFWPYGLEPNRRVLELFLRYSHEQGLSRRRLAADELFAAETLDAFRI